LISRPKVTMLNSRTIRDSCQRTEWSFRKMREDEEESVGMKSVFVVVVFGGLWV